jgi:hypothetical protein
MRYTIFKKTIKNIVWFDAEAKNVDHVRLKLNVMSDWTYAEYSDLLRVNDFFVPGASTGDI